MVFLHEELGRLNQYLLLLGVTNLLAAIDKILKMEESQNTDEIESALETLGLIGTSKSWFCLLVLDFSPGCHSTPLLFVWFYGKIATQGAHFLLTSSNVARHVVETSFDRQGRGRQLVSSCTYFLLVPLPLLLLVKLSYCQKLHLLRVMIHVQAALHAFGSICGVDRQEDQMKLDGQAEEYLKRLVYTTAANSSKLTPSVSSNSFLVCPFILIALWFSLA